MTWNVLIQLIWFLSVVRSHYEPYGENVASRKPANQSTTYGTYIASLGVDGNISTNINDGTCSHTGEGPRYSWWTVYLLRFYFIKFIRIYQWTAPNVNRLDGSEMYVKGKGNTWKKIYFNSTLPSSVFNVSVELDKPIDEIMLNNSKVQGTAAFICVCELQAFKVIECLPFSIGNGSFQVLKYGESNQTFTFGTQLNVSCREGYIMSDDGVLTNETESTLECNANGNWSGNLTCSVIVCGRPPNIPNNSQEILTPGIAGNNSYNATITVECNEGYIYSLQEIKPLRCASDGLWTGNLGNCNVIDCGQPFNIPGNSTVMFSTGLAGNTSYNATLTVRCNKGFNFTLPGHETIRCGNEGRWPDIMGLCKAIECFIIFSIDNGEIKVKETGVDGKNNTYGVKVSVECDSGFTSNVLEITCLESGLSSQPVCSADHKPTDLIAAIVGSVVTFIAVVALVVGIVIFIRRRRKHKDDATRTFDQNHKSKVGGSSNPAEMDIHKGFTKKKRNTIPADPTIAHKVIASGHRLEVKEEISAYEFVEDFEMENVKRKSIGLDTNAMVPYDTLQMDNKATSEYDELKFEKESSFETTMKNETYQNMRPGV